MCVEALEKTEGIGIVFQNTIPIPLFLYIKRWIKDYEREEEITDRKGRRIFKKRKDIIKAYLEYVIAIAELQFV